MSFCFFFTLSLFVANQFSDKQKKDNEKKRNTKFLIKILIAENVFNS